MITVWMIYSAWVAALLALAGRAGEEVAAAYGYPRRWVWLATLVLAVGLAVVAPRRVVESEQVAALAAGVPTLGDGVVVWEPVAEPTRTSVVSGPITILPAPVTPSGPSAVAIGAGWWAGVAGRFAAIADQVTAWVGVDRIVSLERGARSMWLGLSVAMILTLLFALARSSNDRRRWPRASVLGTRVRLAPHEGPVVMGALRPEIVLPQWLLSRPEQEIRLALEHEREHVRAGDRWLLLFGYLVTAVLPWNPAIWWIQSRLRLAVELDCDGRVLGAGAPRAIYGSLLLDIASRDVTRGLTGSVAFAGAPSHLERRIRTMTTNSRRGRARRVWLGGMVTAAAVTLAFVTQVPQAAANVRQYSSGADEMTSVLSQTPTPVAPSSAAGGAGLAGPGSLRRTAHLYVRPQADSRQEPAGDTIELFGVVAGTGGSLSNRATRVPLAGRVAASRAATAAAHGSPSRIRVGEPASGAATPVEFDLSPAVAAVQGVVTPGSIEPVIGRRVRGLSSQLAGARINGSVVTLRGVVSTQASPSNESTLELRLRTPADRANGEITGRVRDAETGAVVPTVQVYLQGTSIGSLTNAAGTYRLVGVPAGTYTLVAQRIGYAESRVEQIEIRSGGILNVDFMLAPAVLALQEIRARSVSEPYSNQRRIVVDGVLLDSLGNEIETLRQRPLIVVDGVIVDQPEDVSNIDELIEPREIDSIEVIKGGAAAGVYGPRARDGVIHIRTREAEPASTPAQQ